MEKAILKTLAYADIFDYPLKAYEIHKWLIGRKATLRQVESVLVRLNQKSKIKYQKGYFFLSETKKRGRSPHFLLRRAEVVDKRYRREKQSIRYLRKAQVLTLLLKIIPWVKLVGISGGLAMSNASKSDDIDLFIITSRNRLWISRFLSLGLLSLTGQRRKISDKGSKITGKLCLNILLEEDKLEQDSKDIYLAHEVLQMKVLWQRDGIYQKYLESNLWAFKLLPNWIGDRIMNQELRIKHKKHNSLFSQLNSILDIFERLAKSLQLKIMGTPHGMERIQDGALYFHPQDCRPKILKLYRQKFSKT